MPLTSRTSAIPARISASWPTSTSQAWITSSASRLWARRMLSTASSTATAMSSKTGLSTAAACRTVPPRCLSRRAIWSASSSIPASRPRCATSPSTPLAPLQPARMWPRSSARTPVWWRTAVTSLPLPVSTTKRAVWWPQTSPQAFSATATTAPPSRVAVRW